MSMLIKQKQELYERAIEFFEEAVMNKGCEAKEGIAVSDSFRQDFFSFVDKINLSLMTDRDNFYGYFLFQMNREISFDIVSPTGVNFKGAKYVIYFNPILFLELTTEQMETTIKHEILHIISLHLIRMNDIKLKGNYSTLAMNLAMDVVVNQFLNYLPPHFVTLEWVNLNYFLELEPYQTFEYYVDKIQLALDLQADDEDGEEDDSRVDDDFIDNMQKIHDIWNESDSVDEKTINEFTQKIVGNSNKGVVPEYLNSLIAVLKNTNGELPWNLYLKKLMGTVESNKKKTVTRRNRRQANRLDLRGELRGHKAEIAVAIDISGSISDEEFKQAIKEVLAIVKNYNHEISIIECDSEIKRVYKVKSVKDVKDRVATGGATEFSPVFEFANKKKINLLIYFTDGKGEKELKVTPRGYKVLWVISGKGDNLSLSKPYGAIKKLSQVKEHENKEIWDINYKLRDGYSMNDQQPML